MSSAAEIHKNALKKAQSGVSDPNNQNTSSNTSGNAPDKHISAEGGEDLTLILTEEANAEKHLQTVKDQYGTYDHPIVLDACLRVLESWICLYKLQPMEDLIKVIEPIAKKRHDQQSSDNDVKAISNNQDDDGSIYIKVLQMKAFMRFKQHMFKEALELFLQFKTLVGPSPALLENIGHTYNALGKVDDAVKCFEEAVLIQNVRIESIRADLQSKFGFNNKSDSASSTVTTSQEKSSTEVTTTTTTTTTTPSSTISTTSAPISSIISKSNNDKFLEQLPKQQREIYERVEEHAIEQVLFDMGGLLMGLATSLNRQGSYEAALNKLNESIQIYKKRFKGQDHSLIGKALTSVSDVYTKMGKHQEAFDASKESVRIFKITCGISPLTANALLDQAECYIKLAENAFAGLDVSKLKALPMDFQQVLVQQNTQHIVQATICYDEAFELHCGFDTPDYTKILKITQSITSYKLKFLNKPYPTPQSPVLTLKTAVQCYFNPMKTCLKTLKDANLEKSEEGSVIFKAFGELFMLGGEYKLALDLLYDAVQYFKTVKHFDCSGLIKICTNLIQAGITAAKRDQIDIGTKNYLQ